MEGRIFTPDREDESILVLKKLFYFLIRFNLLRLDHSTCVLMDFYQVTAESMQYLEKQSVYLYRWS